MPRHKMVEIVIFVEFYCALKTQPRFDTRKFITIPTFSVIARTILCCDKCDLLEFIVTRRDLSLYDHLLQVKWLLFARYNLRTDWFDTPN
jgi:hypothetical protein